MLFIVRGNRQFQNVLHMKAEMLTVSVGFLVCSTGFGEPPRKQKVSRIFICDTWKGEMLKTLSKTMKNKYIAQDRIAMRIADRYGMTHEYKTTRRHHLTPLEALEDWDLIMPEEREFFKN